MNTDQIKQLAIEKLAALHHLPFYTNSLKIDLHRPDKMPAQLPEFNTFSLEAKGDALHIRLKSGMEWRDALLEASYEKVGHDRLPLTLNAKALLDWLQQPGNSAKRIRVNTLGKKAGFKGLGSYGQWHDYCREIELKTNYCIHIDGVRGQWGDAEIELTLSENSELETPAPNLAPNPYFSADPTIITKDACDSFARLVEQTFMESADPEAGAALFVYDFSTHSALEKAWPATLDHPELSSYDINHFLEKVRLAPCLQLAASIEWRADRWQIGCIPSEGLDWQVARSKLIEWQAFKGSRQTFGLSENAGLLLDWLLSLRPDQLTDRLSPPVFKAWKDEIGLEDEYYGEMLGIRLEALADEITECTPYEVRVMSWERTTSFYHSGCRLLFKRRPTSAELLVRQIRHFALDHGALVPETKVLQWLDELIQSGDDLQFGGAPDCP